MKHTKEYYKQWYNKNIERISEKKNKNNRDIRKRNLKYTIEYLQNHSCIDCGEKDFIVLEFDHRENKKYNISEMVGRRVSIHILQEEINKCDIRCANCHRRKTALQLGWYKDI